MKLRTDAARIFLTAVLIYAAFWNPWLQSSMAWNLLDTAVSFSDSGRWDLKYSALYNGIDTFAVKGRVVAAAPPGLAVLIVPVYLGWRSIIGTVDTVESFNAFNGFLVLAVGVPAAAFAAVQVAWLAGWLGASRRGQLLAAALFALGTQNFSFGTMLFREGLAGLAVVTAFRLSVEPGGSSRRTAAGVLAGLATALVYQAGLLILPLLFLIMRKDGVRQASAFVLGCAPAAIALGGYHTWLFDQPWRTPYAALFDFHNMGYVPPKVSVLVDLLVGPGGGLFLYAPFLVFGLHGFALAWRTGRRGETLAASVFLICVWLVVGIYQSRFGDRALFSAGLGPRMMFPAIPLLAAFAGSALAHLSRGSLLLVAVPSLACGYLSAQAGFIPGSDLFPYAVKTVISGTGMGVVFKEALPRWLGFDTLHTVLSRPDVGASDLLRLLPTAEGVRLAGNQLLLLGVNLLVLGGIAWFLLRIWKGGKRIES